MGADSVWDISDAEEGDIVDYFDVIQECIAFRLNDMKENPSDYGLTRDGIVLQLLQLTEFALIHAPPNEDDDYDDLQHSIAGIDSRVNADLEKPTTEWVKSAVDITCAYIVREIERHTASHDPDCPNCKKSPNQSN